MLGMRSRCYYACLAEAEVEVSDLTGNGLGILQVRWIA